MEANTTSNYSNPPSPPDSENNLYNSSYISIFFRNFVAGLAKGLGGIFVYLILVWVVGRIMVQYVLPEIRPLINTFEQLGKLQTPPQTQKIDPEAVNQLMQQIQQEPRN